MAQYPTVFDCSIITLPKVHNRAVNSTPIHNSVEIPFDVCRVFYLYDVPGGESRGAHAHLECHQFLVALSGSFEVLLNDGNTQRLIQLNRPYLGLHIPPMIWASEINFSSGSICLVLASELYNEGDYIRDYEDFLKKRTGLSFQEKI